MDYKDFSKWFEKKPTIHADGFRPFIHEREVWWCHLGINIGSEEDGKGSAIGRPVLIYRKFNRRSCWVIPITTVNKQNAFYIPIDIGDDLKRFALPQHMRSIDSKRLYQYIGMINHDSHMLITSNLSQIAGTDWESKTSEATLSTSVAPGPKPIPQ